MRISGGFLPAPLPTWCTPSALSSLGHSPPPTSSITTRLQRRKVPCWKIGRENSLATWRLRLKKKKAPVSTGMCQHPHFPLLSAKIQCPLQAGKQGTSITQKCLLREEGSGQDLSFLGEMGGVGVMAWDLLFLLSPGQRYLPILCAGRCEEEGLI